MEGTKKISTTIIVILIILVLGLAGFIVYDKVLKKDNQEASNVNENNAVNTDNNVEVTNQSLKVEVLKGENKELTDVVNNYIKSNQF